MSSRQALLTSAITFLRDPTTAASPLAQRVAFLESKGLTPPEIEQALSAASAGAITGAPPGGQYNYPNGGRRGGRFGGPNEFERDWRDWFIMGVIGGTVGYVTIKLAQKFLLPHLQPPSSTDLEASQAALEAKYDEAAELLKHLQVSTDALASSIDEQKEAVDAELEEVKTAVKEMRDGEKRREEWAKGVEGKVEEITRALPAMLEKQSSTTSQSLADLQTELKSLKSLLIARRPTTPSYGSSGSTATSATPNGGADSGSPTPVIPGRATGAFTPRPAGIPSWQLNHGGSSSSTTTAATLASGTTSGGESKDKAKEVDETSSSGILVEKEDANSAVPAAAGGSSSSSSSAVVAEGDK